jgi:hypothetical protein
VDRGRVGLRGLGWRDDSPKAMQLGKGRRGPVTSRFVSMSRPSDFLYGLRDQVSSVLDESDARLEDRERYYPLGPLA